MKLDCGQAIAPVPWPIQSSPMARARNPTVKSNLRMDVPLSGDRAAAEHDQCKGGLIVPMRQGQGVRLRGGGCRHKLGRKKAPGDAGAFELISPEISTWRRAERHPS